MNFLEVLYISENSKGISVEFPEIGEQLLPIESTAEKISGVLEIGIRPEDLRLSKKDNGLPMKVDVVERLGGSTLVYGSVSQNQNFCAILEGDALVSEGEIIKLDANLSSYHVFDSNGYSMRRQLVPEVIN